MRLARVPALTRRDSDPMMAPMTTAQVKREANDLIVWTLTGKLTLSEFEQARDAAVKVLEQANRIRMLVLMQGFEGWEESPNWGDTSFLAKHGDRVAKIAIVGETRWRDEVLMFAGKPFTKIPIQYFADDLPGARAWLAKVEKPT